MNQAKAYARRVDYEWVVEELDDADDIVDCDYYPEDERPKALAAYRALVAAGKLADFGLCRHVYSDAEGEIERAYAYAEAEGSGYTFPRLFDDGVPLPSRFSPSEIAFAVREARP